MKKRSLSMFMAGLMICSTVFSGFSFQTEAADAYVSVDALSANNTAAPEADEVVPSATQYEYQKQELAAFCHFGPNTFNEIEWGESYGDKEPSEIFTLTENFDAETLIRTLKEAGFQKIIVTAKHHDGFCIWNSAYTDYCTKNTTYAEYNYDGMGGDILAEISAACTEYDMDMGLYLSPWDIHDASYGYYDAEGNATDAAGDVLDYNEYYNNQLIEILGNKDKKYGNNGKFVEVWMDGAKGSGANAQEYDFEKWFTTIQQYQGKAAGYDSDCMLFGAGAYTTVRWIGNENGYANTTTWSKSKVNYTTNSIDSNSSGGTTMGYEDGNQWTVPEVDARITSGWFWGTSKCTPKSVTDLGNMYFKSVGYNSPLLLNIPPNNQGTVDTAILNRVKEFGAEIAETFDDNLAENAEILASEVRGNDTAYSQANVVDGNDATYWTTNDGQTTGSLIVKLDGQQTFDVVSIEEAIEFGQRITSYKIEYRNGDDGEWKTFEEGTTVGAKRLSRRNAVKADQLKITVSTASTINSDPGVPMINEIGVYKASDGFELSSGAPEGMDVIDNAKVEVSSGWTQETGTQYTNGTNMWANGNEDGSVYAEFTITGSKAYVIGTLDPKHGKADIYIDGVKVDTIDTNVTSRSVGATIYESDTLSDGEHIIKIVPTETDKAIGIEAVYAINNKGLGMIGIEEASYTMDEDEIMEVKLIRTGGSSGEVTVTLSPNPGSAIQDDFDTELIQRITFADGETEKTAKVRTTRNTNKTGDQYFTIELECDNEDVILGFNKKAKITIRDMESIEGYTEKKRFKFPKTLNDTVTLEAEHLELQNAHEDTDGNWPLMISTNTWASNGKFVNAMNTDDSIILYYNAPVAGRYSVEVTYRSGDVNNGFGWAETDGKITAGSITAGADDKAADVHTVTFELEITEAGKGTLVFTAGSSNAPQLDKFDITLIEKAEPDEVVRVYGEDRNATSLAVATAVKEAYGKELFDTVIVATGRDYADALAGSYLSKVKGAPILLTNGSAQKNAELLDYIKTNAKEDAQIYILGKEKAVSAETEELLKANFANVKRLGGENRLETNIEILKEAGMSGETELLIATSKSFADSLSAAATGRPILLVNSSKELNDAQKEVLEQFASDDIYVLGGNDAVSADAVSKIAEVTGKKASAIEARRLAGATRFETSVLIATTFFEDVTKAVVACGSGENFADGLCGGALASALEIPLILTKDGNENAADYTIANEIFAGYVLGGDKMVSDDTAKLIFTAETIIDPNK